MGVGQLGSDVDLAEKPLRPQGGGEFRPEDFYGYLPMVLEVIRPVDRRHPSTADLALDRVPVSQGRFQAVEEIAHATSSEDADRQYYGRFLSAARRPRSVAGQRSRSEPLAEAESARSRLQNQL